MPGNTIKVTFEAVMDDYLSALNDAEGQTNRAADGMSRAVEGMEKSVTNSANRMIKRLFGITLALQAIQAAARQGAEFVDDLALGVNRVDAASLSKEFEGFLTSLPVLGSIVDVWQSVAGWITGSTRAMHEFEQEVDRVNKASLATDNLRVTLDRIANRQRDLELEINIVGMEEAEADALRLQREIEKIEQDFRRTRTGALQAGLDGLAPGQVRVLIREAEEERDLRIQLAEATAREVAQRRAEAEADEAARTRSRLVDLETQIQAEMLRAEGETLEARLVERERFFDRAIEQAATAAERERLERLKVLETDRMIADERIREEERVAAERERLARSINDIESEILQAQLRIEGRALEARLESIRNYYDRRIQEAEDATERERLIELRNLSLVEAQRQQAGRMGAAVDTFSGALGQFVVAQRGRAQREATADLQEKQLSTLTQIAANTSKPVSQQGAGGFVPFN